MREEGLPLPLAFQYLTIRTTGEFNLQHILAMKSNVPKIDE